MTPECSNGQYSLPQPQLHYQKHQSPEEKHSSEANMLLVLQLLLQAQ